mmetsp:Transcript_45716/g.67989  ORF Transcript_45716/g.67989 Transcript_45716/m.67989 type:complete len:113 (+) Transcript_45716:69-407(+)
MYKQPKRGIMTYIHYIQVTKARHHDDWTHNQNVDSSSTEIVDVMYDATLQAAEASTGLAEGVLVGGNVNVTVGADVEKTVGANVSSGNKSHLSVRSASIHSFVRFSVTCPTK